MAQRTAEATELRIPADPQYIVVAKRVAAGMASVAGLGLEALDELNIAIAEACEHTIRTAATAGPDSVLIHGRRRGTTGTVSWVVGPAP